MSQDHHHISLADAVAMVHRAQESGLLPVKGWSIDAAIIKAILDQPSAAALRAYLGVTEAGQPTLVFVGVDGAGHDVYDGVLAEYALPCPPLCDSSSPFVKGL